MLRLSIFLLLFSFTEESRHKESSILIPKLKKDRQNVIQPKTEIRVDRKLGNSDQSKYIDIESENPDFRTHGPKGADLTLERCFGGLGRWLSLKNNSEKDLAKKQKCTCKCHATRGTSRCIKTSGKDGSTSETCYVYASTKDCDTNSNVGYKRIGTTDRDNVKDTRTLSHQHTRLDSNVSTVTTKQKTVLDSSCDAVSSTVQQYEGTRAKRTKTYRNGESVAWGGDECCCDRCCRACHDNCLEPSFIFTCGALVWCIDQGLRTGCDALCRCLGKCPCC